MGEHAASPRGVSAAPPVTRAPAVHDPRRRGRHEAALIPYNPALRPRNRGQRTGRRLARSTAAGLGHAIAGLTHRGAGRAAIRPRRRLHHDRHDRLHRPALGRDDGLERDYAHPGEIHVEWQLRELRSAFHRLPPKDDSYRSPAWEPCLPVDLPPFLADLLDRQVQGQPGSRAPA